MPGSSVFHYLPEFTQTHVHWDGDVIQPSHLLSPLSLLALNLSQHQGVFQWVSSLYQVVKVLEIQLQHKSFQWIFKVDILYCWLVWSPCYSRESQESSPASQFESINSLVLSRLYGPTLTSIHDYWNWLYARLAAKWCLCFLIHCLGLLYLFFQRASVF